MANVHAPFKGKIPTASIAMVTIDLCTPYLCLKSKRQVFVQELTVNYLAMTSLVSRGVLASQENQDVVLKSRKQSGWCNSN